MELTHEQSEQISNILNSLTFISEDEDWADVNSHGVVTCNLYFNGDNILTSFSISYKVLLQMYSNEPITNTLHKGSFSYNLNVDFKKNYIREKSSCNSEFEYIITGDMYPDEENRPWNKYEEYPIDTRDFRILLYIQDSGNDACESLIGRAILQVEDVINNR